MLKDSWLKRALERAGIDRARWHPSAGVEENRRTIEDVYGYYGRLFLDHPYLLWAGMAGMIGPAFYAGFMDIGFVPDAVRRAARGVVGRGSRRLERQAAGDLGFYETTFLRMQKKIFEDQATMHEAYLAAGLHEIEKFFASRIIDRATLAAWQQIDAGRRNEDRTLLDSGNRALLWREQRDIIDRFYVQMLEYRRPEGPALTYLMTLGGAPSVPGAHAYADVYPLKLVGRFARALITVRTPLAKGNIAVFANRWSLIETDTLPDYLKFVREHGDEARALVATPVAKRAARYRILLRGARLVTAAVTRWRLQVSIGKGAQRMPDVQSAAPPPTVHAQSEVIDLTHPPTRESMGYARSASSRIWMRADRKPFELTVALPDARVYRARVEMAATLSSTIGGEPDHLSVQLPAASAEATERLLTEYASEWNFPRNALTAWRNGADRTAADGGEYGTHVFTADDIDSVHLEFQVSHHVQDRSFVTTALFSWQGAWSRR